MELSVQVGNLAKVITIIKRAILIPTIPSIAALSFASLVGISDAYLAQKISVQALAAMCFCEPLWFLVTILTSGLCSGITVNLAAISHPTLIHTNRRAHAFIINSLLVSAIIGVILLCAALLLSCLLFNHSSWLSGTASSVANYFAICAFSTLPFAIMQAQCAIFRAAGRGHSVIAIWAIATITEVVLSNILITLGLHDLRAFAISWVIACVFAAGTGFSLLRTLMQFTEIRAYIQTSLSKTGIGAAASLISRTGFPIVLGEFSMLCGAMLNPYVLSTLSNSQNLEAAWTIKNRLEEAFTLVPMTAIGLTVAPFISRHCAGRFGHAARLALDLVVKTAFIAALGQLILAAILQCNSRSIAEIFGITSAGAFEATAQAISISSFAFPFFAIFCVLSAALEGMQKAMPVTAASLIVNLPVRVLLTFALKESYGIAGIAIANVVTQILLTVAVFMIFKAARQQELTRCSVRQAVLAHLHSPGA